MAESETGKVPGCVVVMVTLLPALLVICGRWVFWPKRPTFRSAEPTAGGLWARVGRAISPHPRRVWVVTTGLLLLACLGLFRLDAVEVGGALHLGLAHRAVFAFEDFLLSRYHMFLSVYYHYASVNFEQIPLLPK